MNDIELAKKYFLEGLSFFNINDFINAEEKFKQSLCYVPNRVSTLLNLSSSQIKLKKFDEAKKNIENLITIDGGNCEAFSNLGFIEKEVGSLEEAIKLFDKSLLKNPLYIDAIFNKANALYEIGNYREALTCYEKSIALGLNNTEIYLNRGSTLHQLKRCSEAVTCYDQAIALEPENVDAHWNKSLLKLTLGEYAEGWQLYEWRWKTEFQKSTARSYAQPLWLGEQSLENCTILVFAEQGLGDTIQFCRYITLLSDLGAKVILEAPEALLKTLESLQGVNKLIPMGSIPPAFDYYCPLLTLPLAFKTHVATIPNRVPYLKPDPHKAAHWKEVLGTKNRLRVGLVWSGGFRPNQPELWEVNERRNIPLHQLAQLNLPAVDFYSLQKGEEAKATLLSSESSGWNGPKLIDYTDQLVDYSDTAALITNLDLVISVDTSVVHMAGALGKPVWVLNRFDTDWRWFLDRTDSPWYPSATIFHQPNPGDWDSVVVKVKEELKKLTPRVN